MYTIEATAPHFGEYLLPEIVPNKSRKLAEQMFREHVGSDPVGLVTKPCTIAIAAEHSHYFPSSGLLLRMNGVVSASVQRGTTTSGRVASKGMDETHARKLVEAIQNRLPEYAA